MSDISLKPCPCCGNKAEITYDVLNAGFMLWKVICSNSKCWVQMPWNDDKDECIESWNRRVSNE